jgi:DNA polymerase III subunit epsilon
MYAIVDIETTGGSPRSEKITEVAIFIFDGEKIVDEFVSLINPEKDIPYYITGLTGITNEMVANAPRFFEVAKKIVEITKDKIFVAHNANFDYNFIKSEFNSLGYNFKRDILCTVKLGRKLIPGKRSYSLGNICSDLGININDRHRAAGDALATVKLFEILLNIKKSQGISTGFSHDDLGVLHPSLSKSKINQLPEEPGVYYFYDERNELIYIGKSKSIKTRVLTHLGPSKNKTAQKMRKEIADVSFELTGNELVALLLESEEIKNQTPLYNRLQRRTLKNFGIFQYTNTNGYLCFSIEDINSDSQNLIASFDNREDAVNSLNKLIANYTLCQKLCGLYNSANACFHYQLRQCNGACIEAEPAAVYNQRVNMAISSISNTNESLIILDKGRHNDEKSVVRIKNGKYLGFGFIDTSEIKGIESLEECIQLKRDNNDVWQIIRGYLKRSKVERIIRT